MGMTFFSLADASEILRVRILAAQRVSHWTRGAWTYVRWAA
jgi:hypothetical protein